MQPLQLVVAITVAVIAYCCLSGLIGHWIGRALCRSRRHCGKSRVVRFATSYIPWTIAAALLLCAIVLGSASGPAIPVLAFGPFLVTLFVADSLEPETKKCTICGK